MPNTINNNIYLCLLLIIDSQSWKIWYSDNFGGNKVHLRQILQKGSIPFAYTGYKKVGWVLIYFA